MHGASIHFEHVTDHNRTLALHPASGRAHAF
jgi:hypothetical protein